MNEQSLIMLWANCVDRLKDRVNNRSFWEALEQTAPVGLEDNTLIVGMNEANYNLASHITQNTNMNMLLRTVEEYYGRPLKFRLIEGTTVEDWERAKMRDNLVATMRNESAAPQPALRDTSTESWEALSDRISRIFSQFPSRSLPQGKARYANEAIYTLAEGMETLYQQNDEPSERALARILDRLAVATDIPAPMLAFEMERVRAWRKSRK